MHEATGQHTDLTGDVEMTWVWKLNGFGAPSPAPPAAGSPSSDIPGRARKAEDALGGSNRPESRAVGTARCPVGLLGGAAVSSTTKVGGGGGVGLETGGRSIRTRRGDGDTSRTSCLA